MTRINRIAFLITALTLCATLLGLPLRMAQASGPGKNACDALTIESPSSAACTAEMEDAPEPSLTRPVELDTKTQGVSVPRSVLLSDPLPPYQIGWVLKDWYYSTLPGVNPTDFSKENIVHKAKVVYLYKTINVNGMDWHLIGPDRWIAGEHVAALVTPERPEGVSGRWMAIDLTEQTITALVDDKPVFATLISASWGGYGFTREGLFNIYARAKNVTFRGPPWANPPKYVYNFVPSAQFFDGNIAIHGAYWHDWFGFTRTHGCVNLPVGDAKWLWDWVQETADQWGPDNGAFQIKNPAKAPFIYVYRSPDTGGTHLG
jgi:L,D-transpeptidase catalytic domain